MADRLVVALDANLLVALLHGRDVHHAAANAVVEEIARRGAAMVFFDVMVHEAVSVLCRRSREGKVAPPKLVDCLEQVRAWFVDEKIAVVAHLIDGAVAEILEIIETTGGRLNFNDAFLVVLQRRGGFDMLATFDQGFAAALTAFPIFK